MRKKVSALTVFLVVLLLICCGAAAAEGYSPIGADLGFYIFCQTETLPEGYLQKDIEFELVLLRGEDEWSTREPVTSHSVEYVSGDEAIMEAIRTETDPDDGITHLIVDGGKLNTLGKVSFRLHLESEHYSADEEAALEVVPFPEDMKVPLSEISLTASLGETQSAILIANAKAALPENMEVYEAWFAKADGTKPEESEARALPGFSFTRGNWTFVPVETGEYDLALQVHFGREERMLASEAQIPLHISVSGNGQQNWDINQALEEGESAFYEELASNTFVADDQLPAGIEVSYDSFNPRITAKGSDGSGEDYEKIFLGYVSGNPALMGLLEPNEYTDEEGTVRRYVSKDRVRETGEVTIRIRLESEHYYTDREVTLKVIPYEDGMILKSVPERISLSAGIGQTLNVAEIVKGAGILSDGVSMPEWSGSFVTSDGYYISDRNADVIPGLAFLDYGRKCEIEELGEYDFKLEANRLERDGKNTGLALNLPVHVSVTEESTAAWQEGPGNEKAGALLEPNGNLKEGTCAFLDDIPRLYFQSNTLPDNLHASGSGRSAVLRGEDRSGEGEYITRYGIRVVSGDERMARLLSFEWRDDDDWKVMCSVNPREMRQAGEATLLVRAESEHYFVEKEISFRVIPFPEGVKIELPTELTVYSGAGDEIRTDQLVPMPAGFTCEGYFAQDKGDRGYQYINDRWSKERAVPGLYITGKSCKVEQDGSYDLKIYWDKLLYQGEETSLRVDSRDLLLHIQAQGYTLRGPASVMPGKTAAYTAESGNPQDSFLWRVEGENVSIDDSGVLTVAESAPEGSTFTVYAKVSGGEAELRKVCSVSLGDMFVGTDFSEECHVDGFHFVLPQGGKYDWNSSVPEGGLSSDKYWTGSKVKFESGQAEMGYGSFSLDTFVEDAGAAREYYAKDSSVLFTSNKFTDTDMTEFEIEGHPAYAVTYEYFDPWSGYNVSAGRFMYARNNRAFLARVFVYDSTETRKVNVDDMVKFASFVRYVESEAPLSLPMAKISVAAKDDAETLTAGKKLKFTAAFANPDAINKKAKNNGIIWSVVDAETGEASADAKIAKDGTLTAGKGLSEAVRVQVTARSQFFGTEGSRTVTLVPAVSAMKLEPAELAFFTGSQESAPLKVSVEPAAAPVTGLTWKVSGKNIALEEGEDGTAAVRPLAAGKATVTVKEPGGKTAKATVQVYEPVTAVELAVKGKPVPGKKVTLTAKLTPAKGIDGTLKWSLNVDESIATISEKGQLQISKEAPVGTVITVTCEAAGAPEPVTATADITVVEK